MPSGRQIRSSTPCRRWTRAAACWPDALRGTADTGPAPIGPATAATAPAPYSTPTGEIRKLAGHPVAAIVDPATSALVVLGGADAGRRGHPDGAGRGRGRAAHASPCAAPGTALTADGDGHVLVSARGGYFSVDLAAGTAVRTGVDRSSRTPISPRSLAAPTGKLVLGSADGAVLVLSSATGVGHRDKLFRGWIPL